ncbi:MAG: hypothetical protein AB7O32_07650 [Vicinamibacterales bacterium]
MKILSPAVALALALAPLPSTAAPDPALEPLAFLAGHCWIGTIPGTADTDEHCFAWIYEGRYLRDRHVVRRGEKTVYEGESTYYWNSVAKQVEYFYVTAAGGHALGTMAAAGDTLDFPAAVMVSGGKSFGFRGKWKRTGDDGYEVLREYQTDKGWMPVKVPMRRVAR